MPAAPVHAVAELAVKGTMPLDLVLAAVERQVIADTLRLTRGNVSKAAKRLGIHRNTLQRKTELYGL